MMLNSTQVSYFILDAYFDSGPLKYFYFMILMCLYVLIIVSNVLLIVVICVNRSLHEPMYLFLCSLFVNELYGSTGLFPFLLVQIFTDVHTVSTSLCFLQVYCVYFYGGVEFFNLSVMSYDRYVSICHPLRYNTRMNSNKICLLISLTWLYPFLTCLIMILVTDSLHLCGNVINKVYCDNYSIVKLACSDTNVLNIYGLIATFSTIVCHSILILYSYVKILKVCFSGSKQTRHKAVTTCTPHLASLLSFTLGASFELIQSRFNMNNVSIVLRIFLSLYWLTCQPFFNPLMYGLNMSKIRNVCKNLT